MPSSLPHVRTGKLRALAISGARRSAALPDLPTVAESGVPGYESTLWYGVLVPAGTPGAIVDRLNKVVNDILRQLDVMERFAALGAEPIGNTPSAFGAYIRAELDKWGKVIRSAGIRAD
jgi:tripartite-type tricarboxylate transporter receptor subunit TctC